MSSLIVTELRRYHEKKVDLWKQYQLQRHCDVTLTTAGEVTLECHRKPLRSSSYFERKLEDHDNNLNNSISKCNVMHTFISLPSISLEALTTLIRFAYTGECLINKENIREVLKFSELWDFPYVTSKCFMYLMQTATINNACSHFQMIKEAGCSCKRVIDYFSCFIRTHFRELYRSNQIKDLTLDTLSILLKSDEINVESEDVLFESILAVSSTESDECEMLNCFGLIRFEHLTDDYLMDIAIPMAKRPLAAAYVNIQDAIKKRFQRASSRCEQPPRSSVNVNPVLHDESLYFIQNDLGIYEYCEIDDR